MIKIKYRYNFMGAVMVYDSAFLYKFYELECDSL